MAPTPQQKGNTLENAVRGIENLLLSLSPSLQKETYKIESKKIISVGEVRHEIDVFVSVDLGSGYKSVFIFECKNWKDPVSKNEVIILVKRLMFVRHSGGVSLPRRLPQMRQIRRRETPESNCFMQRSMMFRCQRPSNSSFDFLDSRKS